MNQSAKSHVHMFGAWCGVYYIIAILLGFGLIAGFLPPHDPSASADHVAGIFRADATRIRIGMVVVMYSAFIFIPFAAALSHYLAKVEGGAGVLAFTNLLGGAGNMVLSFYPAIWWLTAAYRADRSPELVLAMNDWAWLQFIGGASMWEAMPLSVAIAAFTDRSPNPIFPRWVGFLNVLIVLLVLPDQLLFFFHSGPFAWNGLFGLWLPVGAFGGWFILMALVLRNAVLRERRSAA